jgi:hypothetical protein
MAKKWAEILKDGTAYPDDFTVTLKNGEVMSLGDMRSYDKEHEGELTRNLTAKEQELSARERNVSGASTALAQRIKQAADAAGISVDDFIEGKIPSRKQVAKEQDLDEDDPLVGKLVKELRAVRQELSTTQASIKDIREKAIGPVINTYLEDYYEGRWEKLSTKLPKGAKLELKDVLSYAEKEGLKDGKGRFNLEKAVRDLTYEQRVAEDAEKRVADLRKKDDDQRVLDSIPQPGNTRAHLKTQPQFKNAKGGTKSFDEVMNDALTDTDLWRQVGTA